MSQMPENINLKNSNSAEDAATEVYNYLKKYINILGYKLNNVTLYEPGDYSNNCWAVGLSIDDMAGWTYNVKEGRSISSRRFSSSDSKSEITGFDENTNIDVQCKNAYTLEFYDL